MLKYNFCLLLRWEFTYWISVFRLIRDIHVELPCSFNSTLSPEGSPYNSRPCIYKNGYNPKVLNCSLPLTINLSKVFWISLFFILHLDANIYFKIHLIFKKYVSLENHIENSFSMILDIGFYNSVAVIWIPL